MLDVGDRFKELSDFLKAEDDRELSGLLGTNDLVDDPIAAQGDPVKELQGASSLVVIAPGDVSLLDEMQQVAADVFRSEPLR